MAFELIVWAFENPAAAANPPNSRFPLPLILPDAVIWLETSNLPLRSIWPSILSFVEAFISTVGAVMSNVVPAFISKWPSELATIFSPPAASWNDNFVSPDNINSSADSSQRKYWPEVAPKNLTSLPVSSTPTVNVPSNFTLPSRWDIDADLTIIFSLLVM